MKAIVLQENLHRALSFVGKISSSKTQLPILANILVEAQTGKLILSATNLETSFCFWLGATVEKTGSLLVPARLLSELVNSLSHDKVEISTEATNLLLSSGESEVSLSGINALEYPPLPPLIEKSEFELPKKLLAEALPFVGISASVDEGRPLLTGIKFIRKDKVFYMVATDGYRLSVKKIPEVKEIVSDFVVPARVLTEVYHLLIEEKTDVLGVSYSSDKNQIIFSLPHAQMTTRLIEGEYPNYEKIIPSSYLTSVVFDKEGLLKAVKLAAVYAKESANILKLTVTPPNQVIVSANSPNLGENKTTLEAKVEGEGGEIAFNARFLLDLLSVFPEEEILFEMNGALAPGVFKTTKSDDYLHIIMPVRVQN